MKRILVPLAIALVLIAVVVVRQVQLLPFPQGEGTGVESPDGTFSADIAVMTDKAFFGKTIRYYWLEITESGNSVKVGEEVQILYEKAVPIAPNEKPLELLNLGDEDVDSLIRWAPDSKSVVFSIGDRQVAANIPEQ